MTTWLVCHGAWSAGWAWKKMRPLLHSPPASQLFTPTYTGLGERAHLNAPEVTLETHIADILGVILMEDLSDITLVAHSYGGMVATGVANRAQGRVARLIYLDAFVPQDGESLFALTGQPAPPAGADWRAPPRAMPPDTAPADVAWAMPRRAAQSVATFTTPLKLSSQAGLPPRAYIRCTRAGAEDPLAASYKRAQTLGWPTREIDASHNPHITAPQLLAQTLEALVRLTPPAG